MSRLSPQIGFSLKPICGDEGWPTRTFVPSRSSDPLHHWRDFMKTQTKLLTAAVLATSLGTAMAMPTHVSHHRLHARKNHVTLLNTSAHHKPMRVTYRTVWQNPGQRPTMSRPHTLVLKDAKQIPLHFNHHRAVGIIPTAIDGHAIPMQVTMPLGGHKRCSVAIDHHHSHANLMLTLSHNPAAPAGHRHTFTCSKMGGVVA